MNAQRKHLFIEDPGPGPWRLISTIGPKGLTLVVIMAAVLVATVIAYAVSAGHPVEFFGLSIGQSNEELVSEIGGFKKQLRERPTVAEMEELKNEIAKSLTPSDLPGIWGPGASKKDMIHKIQELKKNADDYRELSVSIEVLFLRLERQIANSGGSINTNIYANSEQETFQLIQAVLQSINAFDGVLDGNQASTNRTLVAFQQAYNDDAPRKLELKPLGFFGRRTLSIIRDEYWRIIRES